ncbi:MAG: hypothetical protein ABFQ65_04745 [Nanoarchaeota archaeon]
MVIKINFSNRTLYSIITLGILIILGTGVYAVSNPGHDWGEIDNIPSGFADGVDNTGTSISSSTDLSVKSLTTSGNINIGSSSYLQNNGNYLMVRGSKPFYVTSSVPTTYIYSDNIYLGASSGDTIRYRANTITGTGRITAGSLAISSTKNCEKIYTDANGIIQCGTDGIKFGSSNVCFKEFSYSGWSSYNTWQKLQGSLSGLYPKTIISAEVSVSSKGPIYSSRAYRDGDNLYVYNNVGSGNAARLRAIILYRC